MQRHWDVEIEGIIIANADHEEHYDQQQVIPQSNRGLFGATFVGENEPFDGNESELAKGDEVTRPRIMSARFDRR